MITPSFSLTATERVLPKLALDFTTASLDPRVTFTRSGATATCVDSSGYVSSIVADIPRFDFDPITLVCKGLLIEESRTNMVLQSEDFGTSWTLGNITLAANDTNSPANTLTADKMTATAATAVFSQIMAKAASAITYTASIFVKGDSTAFSISLDDTTTINRGRVSLNLTTGVLGTPAVDGNFTSPSATVTQYANGFYRLTLTVTSNIVPALRMRPFFTTTDNVVYVWGAQVETGAFATSYIPTTTTALTRNADVATMTGTNFSDWFNATEGTVNLTFQGLPSSSSQIARMGCINDGTVNNSLISAWIAGVTTLRSRLVVGGATQFQFSGTIDPTAQNTYCAAYKVNDFAGAFNASTVSTDTLGTLWTPTQISFGADANGATNVFSGHLKKFNYWPQRLTNAEVQSFSKG